MRRFHALLLAAGLAASPVGAAAAEPSDPGTRRSVQVFEWSMGKGRLGITVVSLTRDLRTHFGATASSGVLVGEVDPGSPGAVAGVRVGDVVVEVNGRPTSSAGDMRKAIAGAKQGQAVEIKLIRDRKPLTVRTTLTDAPVFDGFDGFDGFESFRDFHDFESWRDDIFRGFFQQLQRAPKLPEAASA